MVERVRRSFYWPTVGVAVVACLLLVSAFLWGPPQQQALVLTILGVLSTAVAASLRSALDHRTLGPYVAVRRGDSDERGEQDEERSDVEGERGGAK